MLVIGGGITGAGAARDAAMRGLRTALVERDDFASGTSSRSSRLIHGGVRYLEHGEFHLVFEASRERRVLLTIAPGLVRPLRFTWPVYRGARVPRWQLRAALTLYDALALFRNIEPHRMRSVAELEQLEPRLRREGLVGGATYYDAGTDDARLTLATVRAAADAGALVINHAAVRAIELGGGRGARRRARVRAHRARVRAAARCVVNATGPWSDSVRQLVDPAAGSGVRGTKGAHVTVPRARVGNEAAIAITHPRDGRVMFILPAGKFAIVGTTDTDYRGAARRCLRLERRRRVPPRGGEPLCPRREARAQRRRRRLGGDPPARRERGEHHRCRLARARDRHDGAGDAHRHRREAHDLPPHGRADRSTSPRSTSGRTPRRAPTDARA